MESGHTAQTVREEWGWWGAPLHPPTGTVTFLFTDIEGSTRLVQEWGAERYARDLMRVRGVIRRAILFHGGFEFGTEGDAHFIAFAQAPDALAAAQAIQTALARDPIRVRIGLHTGEALTVDGDYVGVAVHKAARIRDAAHGGQVLVSQATADSAGAALQDLGEWQLKHLTVPERLFQAGSAQFEPPRTLKHLPSPAPLDPLIGRSTETAEVVSMVRENRLVTLTGPAGAGKTRLALEVAAKVADAFPSGVCWVSLASISDPAQVIPAIMRVAGNHRGLAEVSGRRRLLVLLDNCEHVMDAAPGLAQLLGRVCELTVLATSRQRLGLSGEHEYPVPPLSQRAAIELFVTRARQLKADFMSDDFVAEICRRLDGLPLALELAATRIKLLSPAEILSRLERPFELLTGGNRDRPPRQSTMRAALDWSYDLLSYQEQRVFRALGLFVGSFDLDTAETVCGADINRLQTLVDKSLVRRTNDNRFALLETTRLYALDRLVDADELGPLRNRHAECLFGLTAPGPAEGPRLRSDNLTPPLLLLTESSAK
jgi:predicted ATPase/class 3 adenylate cyclase